ncbi:MAG: TonB C-terminal domain-containing protein [Candidatus Omnitrophica bacterium]|nr:TonB C-terminal domain-containing protein [Candidatus Omnitrophota bacterium]
MFLTKGLDLSSRAPLMMVRILPQETLKNQERAIDHGSLGTKKSNKVEKKRQKESQTKPNRGEKVVKARTPHLDRQLRYFERSQTEIDKRVQEFENQLANLASEQKEIVSSEPLTFKVFDLEKVPLQIQEDSLPSYLKRMRAQITKFWAESIESFGSGSKVAVVQYRISADGRTSALKARLISGPENFRETCLTAVEKASPFEPLPFRFDPSVENQYLTVALTFYFRKAKSENLF